MNREVARAKEIVTREFYKEAKKKGSVMVVSFLDRMYDEHGILPRLSYDILRAEGEVVATWEEFSERNYG